MTVLFKPTKSGNYRIEVQAISAKLDKKAKVKDSPFKFAVELEESAPVPTKVCTTFCRENAFVCNCYTDLG